MTSRVTTKTLPPETVATLTGGGAYEGLAEAFEMLLAWLDRTEVGPAGPPRAVFYNRPGQVDVGELKWEVQVPITQSVPGGSEVAVRKVPALQVVSILHRGSYEGLARTYLALERWLQDQRPRVVGPIREIYHSDPRGRGPEDVVTEVQVPIEGLSGGEVASD